MEGRFLKRRGGEDGGRFPRGCRWRKMPSFSGILHIFPLERLRLFDKKNTQGRERRGRRQTFVNIS